jgi:CcmD family protein
MSELAWMFVAFSAVWVGIGIYVLSIGARQRKLESRLEELDRKD